MSSLIKRGGVFYLQIHDARRTPSSKRISLRTTHRRHAERVKRRLDKDYPHEWDPWKGDDPWSYGKRDVMLGEAAALFVRSKHKAGRADKTVDTYAMHLKGLKDTAGPIRLRALTRDKVRSFIQDPTVAAQTRKSRYGQLRVFFRWAVRESYIDRSPLPPTSPKVKRTLPKAISPQQLQVMEEVILRDYKAKARRGGVKGRQLAWTIPAFQIALYTGLRRSELVRLKWSDVRKDSLLIREQKNNREELLPVLPKALEIINKQPKIHDFVVGLSNKRRGLGHRMSLHFRTYRRKAGLPSHLSFHSLRHGYCTMLAEQGFTASEIKRLARHADVSTSMRYVHLDDDHLKRRLREV